MKAALTFKFQTEGVLLAMYVVVAFLGAFLLAMVSTSSTLGVASVMKSWILVTCWLLVVMGRQQSRAIINGARVLRQQRTPRQLWQGWLRASLLGSTRIWGILVLAGTALLLMHPSPWRWSSAAALFSVALSLSTVVALSSAGLMRRAWAWIITVGGTLLLLLTAITIGIEEGLNQLLQAPFVVHALLAMSWPLLAYFFVKTWPGNPPVSVTATEAKFIGVGTRISNYAKRFTPIVPGFKNRALSGDAQHSPATQLLLTLMQSFLFPLISLQFRALPWRGDIHPYHLLGMGLFFLYVLNCLICKDLHWRRLLTPGGLYQRHLGYRIFSTTITVLMAGTLLWVAIGIFVSWAAFDIPLARSLEAVWRYRAFPLACMFAVSLVSVLRALGASSNTASFVVFATYIVSLLALGVGSYLAFGLTEGPVLFHVDSGFLCGLLLATAALVLLSNRLWTVKKLQPFLRLS